MNRFVILAHDWPTPHWDLLLQQGAILRAWRLLAEPAKGVDVPAEPNFDHRLMYLDYEGPVSGGRGSVVRWDAGWVEWLEDRPARVEVVLRGDRLAGRAEIVAAEQGRIFRARPTAQFPPG